ncbi:hypothetical protein HYPBUDRAFT_169985 [Hyphopichia burtonii NRRL Y-1933]|uniref:Uncharacterized protein n=1 Tax=Hyphopichia burtonii NRRL Y-1933 TaxID=984485 RepID=A0A1E4RQ21_9ASCO|nr:hypothetical protein HYPBUDRAFT_169985 [Hyphopichia burtonii NRRL Y-1933]ODV69328.1 hypothetical protein HYPBUDRAFT_169985 [Hyphopichia burtonii NRRL Y-1933]
MTGLARLKIDSAKSLVMLNSFVAFSSRYFFFSIKNVGGILRLVYWCILTSRYHRYVGVLLVYTSKARYLRQQWSS